MLRQLLGLAVLPLNVALELVVLAAVLRAVRRPRLARWVAITAATVLWIASTPVVADAIVVPGGALGSSQLSRADAGTLPGR